MIALEKDGEYLDLGEASITLTLSNPVFSDDVIPVARSLPFELPYTQKNARILEFPRVINNTIDRNIMIPGWTIRLSGMPWLTGSLRVFEVKNRIKISFQQTNFLDFGGQQLDELDWGGDRSFANTAAMLAHAKAASMGTVDDYDYAFPTVMNEKIFEGRSLDISGTTVIHYPINYYDGSDFIDSNPTYESDGNSGLSLIGNYFENTIIPFPYLVYLIKQGMANRNVQVYGSFLENDSVKKIITWNNNVVAEAVANSLPPTDHFDIKNHVPDMTVSEFYRAVRDNFNVGFFFDQKGNLELVANKDVLSDNTAPIDWSGKVIPNPGIQFDRFTGLRMTAPLIFSKFEEWLTASYGDGSRKIELQFGTKNSTTSEDPVETGASGSDAFFPVLTYDEECNVVGEFWLETAEMKNFWTFYLGFLPAIASPARDFPATSYDGDDGTTQHTDFKLSVGETNGLYEYWWEDWVVKFLSKTRPYNYPVKMDVNDLLSFSFKRRYLIKDTIGFVRELKITLSSSRIGLADVDFMKI